MINNICGVGCYPDLTRLGHVRHIEDGCVPKRHPLYKDVCVRDIMAVDIDTMSWESLAADRTKWRSALKQHLKTGEDTLMAAAADKRARRKEGSSSILPETTHRCHVCNKDGHSHIALFSHKRSWYNPSTN